MALNCSGLYLILYDGWMTDLWFYGPFNCILVTLSTWNGDNDVAVVVVD